MKKKQLLYTLIILFLVFLITAMAVGLYISEQIAGSSGKDYLWEDRSQVSGHILVIVDDSSQTYDSEFESGIREACDANRIAVEIKRIDPNNYIEDLVDELNKALYARIDGVIAHTTNHPLIADKIGELYEQGIPVVAMDQDLPDSPRITFVGVNQYDIGYMAGESLAKALDGKGSVAVISENSYEGESDSKEDMMLLGLREVLKSYPDLSLAHIDYTKQGVLSAETVAMDLIRSYEDINGFFCTSGTNTLGVVQMLIDNNMVNNLQLVGYGNDPEILEYISKGNVVDSTIVSDYRDIGKQSVLALVEYMEHGFVSSYINTDIQVVDENNIEAYMEAQGDADEE